MAPREQSTKKQRSRVRETSRRSRKDRRHKRGREEEAARESRRTKRKRRERHQNDNRPANRHTNRNVYRSVVMQESVDVRSTNRREEIFAAGDGRDEDSSSVEDQLAAFEEKYEEQNLLDEGGCASVFAGYRKEDDLPVAIKHISRRKLLKPVTLNGKVLPLEVAVNQRLTADTEGRVGASAAVSLLDWYELSRELVLVFERPVPAQNLLEHVKAKGSPLMEEEAKIILKQLVDAAIDLSDSCVFHRDIKAENILIETGSSVPRVRLIDFGLSCFVKKNSFFSVFYGTAQYVTPEWCTYSVYRPGPTTVWQLGIVLFEMIHSARFNTKGFLRKQQEISSDLSTDCKDFLQGCLQSDPEQRLTLTDLKRHAWLQ